MLTIVLAPRRPLGSRSSLGLASARSLLMLRFVPELKSWLGFNPRKVTQATTDCSVQSPEVLRSELAWSRPFNRIFRLKGTQTPLRVVQPM